MVLLNHVARDHEQIRLEASNLLVVRDAQEPQEGFLGEIRHISGVARL
jgi:hypothetical protein